MWMWLWLWLWMWLCVVGQGDIVSAGPTIRAVDSLVDDAVCIMMPVAC